VDALLRGLSRPLGDGETARERAELLLLLIKDKRVGSFKGSSGQRVRAASAEALMALGHPYALELPPEALDAMREEEREARSVVPEGPAAGAFGSRQRVGFWLALGVALVETLFLLSNRSGGVKALLFILATQVGPTFLLATEKGVRNRFLHFLCLTLLSLAFLWLLAVGGVMWLWNGYQKSGYTLAHFFPLSLALGQLVAIRWLHVSNPERAR
jgi:hypothetical protein